MRVEVAGETPSLTGEFVGGTHRVLESTQNPHTWESAQKGPVCLWVAEEVIESQLRAEQVALLPLGPLPPHTASQHSDVGCPTLVNTYVSTPYYITATARQKKYLK